MVTCKKLPCDILSHRRTLSAVLFLVWTDPTLNPPGFLTNRWKRNGISEDSRRQGAGCIWNFPSRMWTQLCEWLRSMRCAFTLCRGKQQKKKNKAATARQKEVKNIPEHISAQSLHPLWLMASCVIPHRCGFFSPVFLVSIPLAILWEYINFTFQLRRSHSYEVRRGLMRSYLIFFFLKLFTVARNWRAMWVLRSAFNQINLINFSKQWCRKPWSF